MMPRVDAKPNPEVSSSFVPDTPPDTSSDTNTTTTPTTTGPTTEPQDKPTDTTGEDHRQTEQVPKGGKKEMYERQKRMHQETNTGAIDTPHKKSKTNYEVSPKKDTQHLETQATSKTKMPAKTSKKNKDITELENMRKTNLSISSELLEVKSKFRHANETLVKRGNNLTDTTEKLYGVNKELAAANKEVTETKTKLDVETAEVVTLKSKIQTMSLDMAAKTATNKEVMETKKKLKEEVDKVGVLNTKIKEMSADLASKNACSSDLVETMNSLYEVEVKLANEKERARHTQEHLVNTKAELEDANTTLATTVKTLDETKVELSDAQHLILDFDSNKKDLVEANKTIKKIETEMANDKTKIATDKVDMTNRMSDIDDFEKNQQANLLHLTETKKELCRVQEEMKCVKNSLTEITTELSSVQSELSTTVNQLQETEVDILLHHSTALAQKALIMEESNTKFTQKMGQIKKCLDDLMVVITCGESIEGPRVCKNSNTVLLPAQQMIYTICMKNCYSFFQRDLQSEKMYNSFTDGVKIDCVACKSSIATITKSTVKCFELDFVFDQLRKTVDFKNTVQAWESHKAQKRVRQDSNDTVDITPLRLMAKSIALMMMKVRNNENDQMKLGNIIAEELRNNDNDPNKMGDVIAEELDKIASQDPSGDRG